jgi:alkylation response protein AidB-like acyl-CoA dehydrogenase
MDFGLSDDQHLLEETLRGFLSDRVPIERVRALRDEPCPLDRQIWRDLAELGATGVLIPERDGGSGLGMLDAVIVAQALGYAVTPSAFLASAVMAPVALSALEDDRCGQWLAGIAAGEIVVGVAVTERFSVREEAGVSLEGGRLFGKAMMALDACAADLILLAWGEGGLALVDRSAQGIQANRLATTDATRCTSEVRVDGVMPLAIFEDATVAITRALDAGRIALAADTLGACESMIDRGVRYAGQRKQFDRLIGSFQAVKHMCAEMIAELEPARSLLWYAGHAFDAFPEEAPVLACHALSHISEIGREIASISTQVHGGVGWTDEQNLHFWYKRIACARHLLGGPEALREKAASLQSFGLAS